MAFQDTFVIIFTIVAFLSLFSLTLGWFSYFAKHRKEKQIIQYSMHIVASSLFYYYYAFSGKATLPMVIIGTLVYLGAIFVRGRKMLKTQP